jgi:hypothetical protein
MSISTSLHRAAQLQEKIDELRGQLSSLLDHARSEMTSAAAKVVSLVVPAAKSTGRRKARRGRPKSKAVSTPKPAVVSVSRGRKPKKLDGRSKAARAIKATSRSPLAGQKRAASPSGPLAPAVVKVLKAKKGSMSVRDILDDLLASGYKFNTPDPKKNLAARIYRLKGVKQVGQGLFATA